MYDEVSDFNLMWSPLNSLESDTEAMANFDDENLQNVLMQIDMLTGDQQTSMKATEYSLVPTSSTVNPPPDTSTLPDTSSSTVPDT